MTKRQGKAGTHRSCFPHQYFGDAECRRQQHRRDQRQFFCMGVGWRCCGTHLDQRHASTCHRRAEKFGEEGKEVERSRQDAGSGACGNTGSDGQSVGAWQRPVQGADRSQGRAAVHAFGAWRRQEVGGVLGHSQSMTLARMTLT